MTDNNELTKDDIVIDPEIEVDAEDPNGISVYIETWFDVDEKFGINTKADDSECLFCRQILRATLCETMVISPKITATTSQS